MFTRFVSKEGSLVISDSLRKAWQNKKLTFFANFIQSPLVLLSLLAMAWGFHYLIRLMDPFYLPAPIVSCLVVLLVLSFLSWLSPVEYDDEGNRSKRRKYADPVLKVIEKPCDLIIKHMAVCFTPSFILIPSGAKMSNEQIGLLTAWFLTSFVAVFAIVIILHRLLGLLPFFADKSKQVDVESTPTPPSTLKVSLITTPSPLSKTSPLPPIANPPPVSFSRLNLNTAAELEHNDRRRKSSVTTMVNSVMDLKAYGEEKEREREKGGGLEEDERRAGSSQGETKKEDRSWVDEVDLGLRRAQSSSSSDDSSTQDDHDDQEEEEEDVPRPALFRKSYDWDARTIRDDGQNSVFGEPYIPPRTNLSRPATPFPPSDTKADLKDIATRDLLVARLSASLDISLYFLFVVISVPIFYATRCSVPFFLTLNILMYLLVIKNVPKPVAKFAHPILTTSFLTFFLIWGFGASVGWGLQETLSRYSTGAGYIQMWSINSPPEGRSPGAGDLLVDGLDAGIIALALPLYRYRADLRKYFFRMMSLIVPAAVVSLFVWPLGAIAVGLEPKTALAFVGRFSSTPLAVAQVARLMGDESITVVLVVITGILVVIFEKQILSACRVKEDDFLAVGLLFGVTAGAIGAAGLHNSGQPRAAAIASLTFALFGTVLLIAIGIPPVAMYIQKLIGV